MVKKAQIIHLPDIQKIGKMPAILGYLIVENFIIDKFFVKLRSHTTDLYDFRLVRDKKSTVLFYGSLESENSNVSAAEADKTAGWDLKRALRDFAQTAADEASRTNKCVVKKVGDIQLIACSCANGDTVIGGWYNSRNDSDISLQMLAYCMYAFAVLNTVYGPKDKVLKEKAIDSIPNDSRFAKYSSHVGEATLIAAIYSRHERMLKRARRESYN